MSSFDLIAYIDGGSRGNPGPAAFGVVIEDGNKKVVDTLSESIGIATNNVAEYRALLAALAYAAQNGGCRLQVYCDSELVVRQMQGRYRVQSPDLKPLYEHAKRLAASLEHFSITHVPRERNAVADQLANEAMDNEAMARKPSRGTSPRMAPERPPGLALGVTPEPAPEHSRSLIAVFEDGRFTPLLPPTGLEQGAEYELRLHKRRSKPRR